MAERKVWREAIKRNDQYYTTLYPVVFSSNARAGNLGLDDPSKAPRSLAEAEEIARAIVEDEETQWDRAVVYELRARSRFGIGE